MENNRDTDIDVDECSEIGKIIEIQIIYSILMFLIIYVFTRFFPHERRKMLLITRGPRKNMN